LPLNDSYPDRWRKEVARKIQKRRNNLVLGDSVHDLELKNGAVVTRQGKTIPADLVVNWFPCCFPFPLLTLALKVPTFGGRPNTSFIKTLGSDVLSTAGYVRVKRTLQLDNHPRIFAMGDIIDWKEEKQAFKAMGHVPIVVNNVMALINDKSKFKEYKGAYEIIALTNGKVRLRCLFSHVDSALIF